MTFAASVTNNKVSLDNNDIQKVVETCCLGCVFAQGRTEGNANSLRFYQSNLGCSMGALSKYQTQGEEIQDATDKDRNEFHVVRGRVCPFHRTPLWSFWRKQQNHELARSQVRQEVRLSPDVVIYLDNDMEPSAVLDTAEALAESSIVPARLYIANNSDLRPSELMKLLRNCPLPWRAETMVGDGYKRLRALDLITKKCNNLFVTYFNAGYIPPKDFFDPIDRALYDDLDKFICLEPLPDSINCLTVMRIFYRQADGNARIPIWEKAKKISEDQRCQYLVRPVTKVVTQLSQ